jgi:hypothetical protein
VSDISDAKAKARSERQERYNRASAYLFAAHGAGLVGCFSALKEATSIKGVGFFITCFAIGFLCTTLSYAAHHTLVVGYRIDGDNPERATNFLVATYLLFQAVSFFVLVFTLLAIIYHFHSL